MHKIWVPGFPEKKYAVGFYQEFKKENSTEINPEKQRLFD
jgi:hypothetical protein